MRSAILCALGALVLALWHHLLVPEAHDVVFSNETQTTSTALPFRRLSETDERYALSFEFSLSALSATRYRLWADDCLDHLVVNGRVPSAPAFPLCDWGKAFPLDLTNYLKPGANAVTAVIRNSRGRGGLALVPDPYDPRVLAFRLTTSIFVVFAVWAWAAKAGYSRAAAGWAIAGVLLRLYYFFATPLGVRTYDIHGHLDYIRYVAEHLRIPPASAGWEFHQAPLYYFLSGGFYRAALDLGRSLDQVLSDLQALSFALSCGTLAVALRIGQLVFPKTAPTAAFALFAAIVATAPSLVFSATRVSNDTLFHFFAFVWCLYLLRWWQEGSRREWWRTIGSVVILWWTKAAAAPLVAVTALLGIANRKASGRERFLGIAGGGFAAVLAIGAYSASRFAGDGWQRLGTKLAGLSDGLRVPNELGSFLTFNPFAFFSVPFNHSWQDSTRRQYFWEYLFRSVFFGEFQYPERLILVAQVILGLGMLWLAYSLLGWAKLVRCEPRLCFFLSVVFAGLIGSLVVLRLLFPYAPHQDFRFIHLAIVPLAAFAAYFPSGESLSAAICRGALYALAFTQALFVLLLWNPANPL